MPADNWPIFSVIIQRSQVCKQRWTILMDQLTEVDKLDKFLSFFWFSPVFTLLPPLAILLIKVGGLLFVLSEFQPTQL